MELREYDPAEERCKTKRRLQIINQRNFAHILTDYKRIPTTLCAKVNHESSCTSLCTAESQSSSTPIIFKRIADFITATHNKMLTKSVMNLASVVRIHKGRTSFDFDP